MASNRRCLRIGLIALFAVSVSSGASAKLTLEQAGSRREPSYAPAYEGQQVSVEGVIAARPIRLRDYSHVVLQDSTGHGLTLEGNDQTFAFLEPGDQVQVDGQIFNRAGLPVLQAKEIVEMGRTAPPPATRVEVSDLKSFSHLGTLIVVDSYVITTGDNSAGDVILIGSSKDVPVRVFLPRDSRANGIGLTRFAPGDRISVIGFGSQYCPVPPHDHSFQILIGDASAVQLLDRGWIVPPEGLLVAFLIVGMALGIWWLRERTMSDQRRRLRALTTLAEEAISATTPGEISRKVHNVLLRVLKASDVSLYLFMKNSNTLDRVPTSANPEPRSVNINAPIGQLSSAVALAFRNRTLVHVPDTSKSPILQGEMDEELPRAILFVPMFAQQDLLGMLVIKYATKVRSSSPDEQVGVQHLANQIATSLKLQEQQSMRDQLLRSEKMAAAGQLISGVANELRGPLDAIDRLASKILTVRPGSLPETDLREIAFEAHRGSEIVRRLVSFSDAEQTETKPLNITGLVSSLIEFREREWIAKGVHSRDNLPQGSFSVLGNQSQLEQVMLNLLVHAEQCLAESKVKTISVSSRVIGRRVLVSIDYSDLRQNHEVGDPFEEQSTAGDLGLQVCRAVVQGYGGEIRLLRDLSSGCRFEVELPLYQYLQRGLGDTVDSSRRANSPMTILIVEPDMATQRKLLGILSSRGHRVVPVTSAEEATEMVHRLRFDITFCSVRLPGLNWVEFFDRIRRQIGAFVLLAEGHDSELARAFKGGEGYLLSKPLDEAETQKLLLTIEERHESLSRQ
jgi:signal transduction histidine kinase/ActR/RegA family two-component response regulator